MTICTRCDGTGFINYDERCLLDDIDEILTWLEQCDDTDMGVCDCCGDGEVWYGEPGCHYTANDPPGKNGPYAYNGGLCECH
jgi:hypothetical protein